MAGSERLVATLVSGIMMLSALNARGWQSSNSADGTRAETTTAPTLTMPRAPEDMPPNPPKVTCEDGKLTISATNSTLSAVLNAIRSCTGAEIEVTEGARKERLFAELGPGPVRAVLADFLSSTDFNYVIKGSPSDPQKIQMVLVNLHTSDSAPEVAMETASSGNMSANRRAWLEARHNYEQSVSPPDEESTQPVEAASSASASPKNPAATTDSGKVQVDPINSAPVIAAVTPPAESEISSGSAGSSSTSSQGKAMEEMISNMQRLFEKRKQMAQQQVAAVR
jgi:hypothetical protein